MKLYLKIRTIIPAYMRATVCVCLTLSTNVFAKDEPIERIVTTGTRVPKLLNSSPVKVSVVSQEQINRLSKGTLRQILEVIPGVVVRRSEKEGYNIQLNGFNSDNVLVLINNQPIVSPTGSSADLDQISVVNIAQIEVVRGAASVLYGSAAMGGVINIITEQPTTTRFSADYEISHFPDSAISGEELGHTVNLAGSGSIKGWKLNTNIQSILNPGFDHDPDTVIQDGGAVDKHILTASISKSLGSLVATYQLQVLDEEKDKPQSSVPGQDTIISYQSDVIQARHDLRVESENKWYVNARYISHDEHSGSTNSPRHTDIVLAEIEGQTIASAKGVEWVGGGLLHIDKLDQRRKDTNVVELDNESRSSGEIYIQGNWQSKGNTQILGGMRIQNDSDFGWYQAIKLSMSRKWLADSFSYQWRVGGGSSYRVPNLKERYYVFDHSYLGYMVLGNEALVPETALGINSGLSIQWHQNDSNWQLNASGDIHFTDAENFITTEQNLADSVEAGIAIYEYQNKDSAILYGADLELSLNNFSWDLSLNYSYLHTEDHEGFRLPERPKHLIKASLTYRFNHYEDSIQIYAVHENDVSPASIYSQTAVDSYTTINFVWQQALSDFNLRIGIENLTDEHRDPTNTATGLFDARPVSARRVYASLGYIF